jgi:hypothetical protein
MVLRRFRAGWPRDFTLRFSGGCAAASFALGFTSFLHFRISVFPYFRLCLQSL